MAGFGPELVVEEEESVGGCSHVELPIGARAGLSADGYDSTGDVWSGKLAILSRLAAVTIEVSSILHEDS